MGIYSGYTLYSQVGIADLINVLQETYSYVGLIYMMNAYSLPLFPLNVVVCPGGVLPLRIFEARYLDMIRECLRDDSPFAIATVIPENDTDSSRYFPVARTGTLVNIMDVNVTTVGLMMIRCVGQHRISINSFSQLSDGLVIGEVTDIANDLELPIPHDLEFTSSALELLLESLPKQGISSENMPVIKPYKLDDASWVANRWLELLDLPLQQKQSLMQHESPIMRLEVINDILNSGLRKMN